MTKKVLIIGGTGYIGSALYNYLINIKSPIRFVRSDDYTGAFERACNVDTVDLEWWGNYVNSNNIIMDYRYLTAEQLAKYDVVVLLAAHSSVPMANNSNVSSTLANNVSNFVGLVAKMRKGQKLIYAGSSSVYNGIPDDNVTEDYPLLAPSNIYDLTKQDIDRLIALYPDVEYYGLRFATVNGLSPNLRTDIMINMMVENALLTGEVKLFNENIRRPILDIDDLMRAIETVIACKDDKRGVYNLSSFNGTAGSIAEGVAASVGANLTRVSQEQVAQALNTKLPAAYDFSISANKFSTTFGFQFGGTIKAISSEVAAHFKEIHTGKRIKAVNYV